MKDNIKLETLTQVFVGSGEKLLNHCDFVVRSIDGEEFICILDIDKLGQIVGVDRDRVESWVAAINNGDVDSFLNNFTQGTPIQHYSKRMVQNFAKGTLKKTSTLATCMHDGRGLPYLPGSSIKGAIRTAVVSSLAREKMNLSELNLREVEGIENQLLGKMQNDLFRFIRVGDAFFNKDEVVAVRLANLNQTGSEDLFDAKKAPQNAEVIDQGVTTTFALKLDVNIHTKLLSWNVDGLKIWPESLNSIPNLFNLINAHNKSLVEYEIKYWNEVMANGYDNAYDYVQHMQEILGDINACQPGECVLRMGQGIGWRFMTGAWAENLNDFYENLVPKARPGNNRYQDYDFPKSRRIDDEQYLLGFVKLSLID